MWKRSMYRYSVYLFVFVSVPQKKKKQQASFWEYIMTQYSLYNFMELKYSLYKSLSLSLYSALIVYMHGITLYVVLPSNYICN